MIRKLIQRVTQLMVKGLLPAVFMMFCIFVGLAAIPQFLVTSGSAIQNDLKLHEYIDEIDLQYFEMLSTGKTKFAIQNKATYINFNGLMARILGQREINDVIKLDNGYLSWKGGSLPQDYLDDTFKNIQKLAEEQKEHGKEFLFVLAPAKTYQQEQNYPIGYKDSTNSDVEYFLNLLRENNVDYLDLRQKLAEDGISYEDAFYVTDHHWTTQTGFWAYTKIIEKLKEIDALTEINAFYIDPGNYLFEIYENSFLGSMGKRTGVYYAGVDDFCVITPKFTTDISVHIPAAGVNSSGDYANVAFNPKVNNILEDKDYFNDNLYGMYGWSDWPHTSWGSRTAPENKKVMLIGNSYGNVPFSFMPLYFTSCEELDMRYFEDDFKSFYDEYSPDVVVLLVHVDNVISENTLYPFF